MRKISFLIVVILSLAVSPVLAADNCFLHSLTSSTGKYEDVGIVKQGNAEQSDKMSKVAHCCCQHHVVARLPLGGSAFMVPVKKVKFVLSHLISPSFGEQPPLAPPKHI